MDPSEYDGFYFLPGDDEDQMKLSFFEFDGKLADSKKVESNNAIGDVWHIAFFTQNDAGMPVFDDSFEAILGNPEVYIKNLCGSGLYGCVLRKTDKSVKWFNDYLNKVKNRVIIMKLKSD
jgi:hypothetical protein